MNGFGHLLCNPSDMSGILTRSLSRRLMSNITIQHDKRGLLFRALSDDQELGHLEYRLTEKDHKQAVDFHHTYTSPAAQGKGIAGKMVTKGLEWARAEQLIVIPTCSYVAAFIQKNPEWKSLL